MMTIDEGLAAINYCFPITTRVGSFFRRAILRGLRDAIRVWPLGQGRERRFADREDVFL
jgi:hypothetical protein